MADSDRMLRRSALLLESQFPFTVVAAMLLACSVACRKANFAHSLDLLANAWPFEPRPKNRIRSPSLLLLPRNAPPDASHFEWRPGLADGPSSVASTVESIDQEA